MRALGVLAVVSLMLVYPVLVYFGLRHFGPTVLAAFLCAVVVLRLFVMGKPTGYKELLIPLVAVGYCVLVAVYDSQILLKYYPVLMSIAVASLFLVSLGDEEPLLEKGARLSGKFITKKAKIYLRKLTVIWAVVILINGGVAGYTACCTDMDTWGMYNGLISYVIFACLLFGEWLYRQYYIRRYDHEQPVR